MIAHPDDTQPLLAGRSGPLVVDVMLRSPKTLPHDASIAAARAVLAGEHVHMVLLTRGRSLVGTLVRTDLPPEACDGDPAARSSTLAGRTVSPGARVEAVHRLMLEARLRRLAVTDSDGRLLGLMCLKRHRQGFCSDDEAAARSGEFLQGRPSRPFVER